MKTLLTVLAMVADRALAPLRVCADPNNLPFTNDRLEGFENRIAALLARDLGTTVEYTWWAQRRGFFRDTLNANVCDLVMGIPSRMEMAATTCRITGRRTCSSPRARDT
jgi:mxaJ protein